MKTKKNIFLWSLYDFANSLVSIVFFLYFAQWIVIENGLSDLWFNLTFTVATLLLLITVPFVGVELDRCMRRITGLRWTTIGTALLYAFCAIFAIQGNEIGALITFTLGLYMYQLTFTFYTPLINDISIPEKRGKISGYGVMANYTGQFVGLLFVLPFSRGAWNIFNTSPRVETLLPAVILFLIFSLPMLLFFTEPIKHGQLSRHNIKQKLSDAFVSAKQLFSIPSVSLFVLAYFLFNDAILTASNNFPIFLEQVCGVSDTIKTYILLGIVLTSSIGGLVSGIIADKFGHKRTLFFILTGWVFILPLIGFVNNFVWFVVLTTIMGLWFGANWAVSRSVMSYLVPSGKLNTAFAYFGLIERTSSLVGPVVWGLMVSNLIQLGSDRYRIAVLTVTVFILLGLLALNKVRDDRSDNIC
jgi:UMF1 family MFS transporter